MKNIKLFTHTDLDGVGCAVVASMFARKCECNIDIEFCENNEVDLAVTKFIDDYTENRKYDMIFITDLSVNEDLASKINQDEHLAENLMLMDHHETALTLNRYGWARVHVKQDSTDRDECGTSMLYSALFSPDMRYTRLDKFVEAVRLWDTWLWKENDALEPQIYNTILKLLGREEFMNQLNPLVSDEIHFPDEWLQLYEKEVQKREVYINGAIRRSFIYNVDDNTSYICVFANHYLSELGNRLALKHPECECCVIIHDRGVSLRGVREDVDVSEIAAKLGGGGHKQAAGFNFTQNVQNTLIKIILEGNQMNEV